MGRSLLLSLAFAATLGAAPVEAAVSFDPNSTGVAANITSSAAVGTCIPGGCGFVGSYTTTGGSGVCVMGAGYEQTTNTLGTANSPSDSGGHTWTLYSSTPVLFNGVGGASNPQYGQVDIYYMWYTSNLSAVGFKVTLNEAASGGWIVNCFTGGLAGATPFDTNGLVSFNGLPNNGATSWKIATQTAAANSIAYNLFFSLGYGANAWTSGTVAGATAIHSPNGQFSSGGVFGIYLDAQYAITTSGISGASVMNLSALGAWAAYLGGVTVQNTTQGGGGPTPKATRMLLMGVQ